MSVLVLSMKVRCAAYFSELILRWRCITSLFFRYYSVRDRGVLQGEDWKRNTASYLKQLKCPYGFEKHQNAALDWLLNYAVRLEFAEQKDNIK